MDKALGASGMLLLRGASLGSYCVRKKSIKTEDYYRPRSFISFHDVDTFF